MRLLTIVTIGLLLAADAKEDAAKKEGEKLQGTWKVLSMERDGKPVVPEGGKQITVVFKGDRYTLPSAKGFTGSRQGSFKLDLTKKPKAIDITPSEGPNKGKVFQGIYEIEGDRMKTCYDTTGKGRPAEFSSKPDSGRVLITYQREKP